MKEELQRVFPEKSGKNSAEPWNLQKAHAPDLADHTVSKVLVNGTTVTLVLYTLRRKLLRQDTLRM